jgi:hypothetical protein
MHEKLAAPLSTCAKAEARRVSMARASGIFALHKRDLLQKNNTLPVKL